MPWLAIGIFAPVTGHVLGIKLQLQACVLESEVGIGSSSGVWRSASEELNRAHGERI